jgi:hypothetical protein
VADGRGFFDCCLSQSRRPFDAWLASLTPVQRQDEDVKEAEEFFVYDAGNAIEYLALAESASAGVAETQDDAAVRHLAIARLAAGRDATALLAKHRGNLEDRVKGAPADFNLWMNLALNCALQGDRARAELALQRTMELVSEQKEPSIWFSLTVERIQTLACLGDKDAAVDLLAKIVRRPGPLLHSYRLKFSLDWWPLRGNPRFEALLADPVTHQPEY